MLLTFTNCFIATKIETLSSLSNLLYCSFIIFGIGLIGTFYNRQDLLLILICYEILSLAVGMNIIVASITINKASIVLVMILISLAAVESAIGLALYVVLYRLKYSVNFVVFSNLKF